MLYRILIAVVPPGLNDSLTGNSIKATEKLVMVTLALRKESDFSGLAHLRLGSPGRESPVDRLYGWLYG